MVYCPICGSEFDYKENGPNKCAKGHDFDIYVVADNIRIDGNYWRDRR